MSKLEKFLSSRDSISLLMELCLRSLLKKDEDKSEGEEKKVKVEGASNATADAIAHPAHPAHPLSLDLPADCKDNPAKLLGPEDEATEQKNATLAYNAIRILKKLSEKAPGILYNNLNLLAALHHMLPVCLANSEASNNKHILATSLLNHSGYQVHQRASVTMEIAYRNAHQLKLLCEVIIQYCRTNPADANTPHSSEMFEQLSFSLLPVLTMKLSIVDFTFLLDFFRAEMPMLCASSSAKKQMLRKTFSLVAGKRASVALKVKIIQVTLSFLSFVHWKCLFLEALNLHHHPFYLLGGGVAPADQNLFRQRCN